MNPWQILLLVVGLSFLFYIIYKSVQIIQRDPRFWESDIKRYERQDVKLGKPKDIILFVGSSSINFWHTLQEDMAPLKVLGRGFGGARIPEVIYYAKRILFPYQPRGVVFYCGENDIAGMKLTPGDPPEKVLADFQAFCSLVHEQLPVIPIYFISIKPPKTRAKHWPGMQRANQLIEAYTQTDDRLHYIDITGVMFDKDGKVRKDLFKWDGIHLNPQGYQAWTSVIKPILLEDFPLEGE